MSKLTPWFPPEIKPMRVGDYECKDCNRLHYWSGEKWCLERSDIWGMSDQDISWRGVSRKPK